MKTNAILIRPMGNFNVTQRTQDGMFNATELLKQWNGTMNMKKEINDYFDNNASKEFINTIIKRENLNKGNYPYLKSRGRHNGGTWMHPLLFIDFAMWINPTFKYDVIKFVYDELIKYRNEAGDAYRNMSYAIATIVPKKEVQNSIQVIAKAVNYIAFNEHETAIRNRKGENEMKELVEIEKQVANLINDGFIKSFDELHKYLQFKWRQKYQPSILA
jgi:hypothetical protein